MELIYKSRIFKSTINGMFGDKKIENLNKQ